MNARNCYGVGTVGTTSTRMMLGLYVPYHYSCTCPQRQEGVHMDWRSRMRAQPCELGETPPPAPNARSSDSQSRLDACAGYVGHPFVENNGLCERMSHVASTEIVLLTLPIIYHLGKETEPIRFLFGTVSCENRRLVVLGDLPHHNNCAVPISFAMRRPLSYCGVNSGIQLVEMSDVHFRMRQVGSEAVVGRVVAIRPGKTHIGLGLIGVPTFFPRTIPAQVPKP